MTPLADLATWAAAILEVAGIGAILLGAVWAAVRLAFCRDAPSARYRRFRLDLGKAILLGLEFLVGADIIRSVAAEPTLEGVAVLGLIVAVRTFLSFTLTVELEGHWPWQRPREPPEAGAARPPDPGP